ncbi:gamma-glutamyl AIG2-like cyclotransferase [Halohasta litchfieldiae]|jgi:gamma-glutamylcyclotransferase (GGCT)/AIG2-like uncharacterized protein YtfP|uniref:Gamma-glutamyl cyclotransferase, AIG2-like n=1 Tax=Halohasta litchfieldiae TaxID=1073996 RepID=A0A1H6R5A0_9EURY|nr:gamma-glutamylcyclotransferase family protein [Halohasta litchfieldiae]ATW88686.1 gamma-glutamyl AIG2-like cyclotransferase [Halohasta litchfieldiae]SEI46960.1 Gamma-glutamyl cyclotransferase, AIG2-like [Halohasta litchfieldiae]
MTVVFVYGTLTDPQQVSTLLDECRFGPPAVCHGLQRVDGRYPTLVPGEQVAGRLLATPEIDRLDGYEGVDRGLYCRCTVPVLMSPRAEKDETKVDGSMFDVDTAAVYIGAPNRVGVSEDVDWPGSGAFDHRVVDYIETNEVHIEINPVEMGNDDS